MKRGQPANASNVGVRRCFEAIGTRLEMATAEADEFVLGGGTIVVFAGESRIVKATGEPSRNELCQKVRGKRESDSASWGTTFRRSRAMSGDDSAGIQMRPPRRRSRRF